MINGIGNRFGFPLDGPGRVPPPTPPPPPPLPIPPAPAALSVGDTARFTSRRSGMPELGPLPFEAGGAPSDADLQDLAVATRQAGFGGLLDRVVAGVASQNPDRADGLPVLFDAPAGFRAAPRRTLDVARGLAAAGQRDGARGVAALAAETAGAGDRPLYVAAALLADRNGGRTEASHALFRAAERTQDPADALATARRSLAMGYPENARHAYWRAAQLAPDAAGALAAAREATARGLSFEAGEPAAQRWREGQDRFYRAMEGPAAGPTFDSASPYGPRALPRTAFMNPYLVAVRRAAPVDLGTVARAATLAGEGATAALAWRRVREIAGGAASGA